MFLTREQREALVEQVNDLDDALDLIWRLQGKFSVAGVVWTRQSIEESYGRQLTEDEWDTIRHSRPYTECWWVNEWAQPGELLWQLILEEEWPPIGYPVDEFIEDLPTE